VFRRALEDVTREGESALEDLTPHWIEEGKKHATPIIEIQNSIDVCNKRPAGTE
jgi:hypothetical protein